MRTLILAAALLAAAPAYAQGAPKYSTTTTPYSKLLADPAAKAVIEKLLPESLQYADVIGDQTLKEVQPMAQGAVTDEMLAKVDAELAKIK
jgi:hypothetical protein